MEETKKTKINDMTQGSPLKVLILFAVPIIFSNLLQQLYNIADSVIVGNYLGTDGLAAVGAAGAITSILVNVAFGLSAGASVVISQLYGAKLLKRMKTSATTFIIFSGAVGLIMMTIVIAFAREMLMLINTPESILEEATTYLVIYFIGCVPVFLYNAFNAVYLGLGDSRKPLYFLGIASVMNIGLDLLFVAAFKMGIGGAALFYCLQAIYTQSFGCVPVFLHPRTPLRRQTYCFF